MPRSSSSTSSPGVRRRALIGVLISGIVAAGFAAFLSSESAQGRRWVGPGVALPFVPMLYFLTELIFGQPVPVLARKWDSLAGWQRGLFLALIFFGFFAVLFVVLLAIAD